MANSISSCFICKVIRSLTSASEGFEYWGGGGGGGGEGKGRGGGGQHRRKQVLNIGGGAKFSLAVN